MAVTGNDIPGVTALKREMHWDGGEWKYVLVVETDRELDPNSSSFDAQGLHEMMEAVGRRLQEQQSGYHSIVLKSAG